MRLKFSILFIFLFMLTSCGGAASPTPAEPSATFTPVPADTSTPVPQPLTILVLPADLPKAEYDQYQTMIYNLSQAAGMRFQVRNSLTTADLAFEGPALKVVVAVPPDPGLEALAAAAPDVQFLAINIPDLPTAVNLSTVGATGVPVDQQAFLAGYIAAMVASEWKTGILYQKDTDAGEAAKQAFNNGYTFFCGTCRNPVFSNVGNYPVMVGIPTDAKPGEYPAYADLFWHNGVKAVYVVPALATADLVTYMADNKLLVIGETLPSEDARASWIASIQPDVNAAIQKIFPELVQGKGGQVVPTPLFLTDVNSDLLSEGKLRLVQQVLDGLIDGTVGTGVTP